MKALLTLLTAALLATGTAACGTSSKTGSALTTANSPVKPDRDDDGDHNNDDNHVLYYGHAAGAEDRQEITTLVTRYYAAAPADDGAKACSLLMPFIAEAIPENTGRSAPLRGKSCAVVLSKLFRQRHALLAGESAGLKVVTVRVEGGRALTVLSFANLREVRQLIERRDGSHWKVLTLLDGILE